MPYRPLEIYLDGACPSNGSDYGDVRHTNQRAELLAVLLACELAERVPYELGIEEAFVVFKSDSDYVVKCMTEYRLKWQRNGFISAAGQPVKNEDMLSACYDALDELGSNDVDVTFQHIPRARNTDADRLAKAACV